MSQIREILVLGHNHFDPMWRRCFLADAEFNGVTVKPYADIEERVLGAWLALAPRGYTFTEGQAVVLREWLRRDSGRREQLKAEIARGRFCVVQAGETVQDSNLPTAEGLVRNFLVAQPLWRELGVENTPGQEIAWLEDAFGNSANYPQVLRGVGCRVAAKLSYRACPDDVWVGIDGTALPVLDHVPQRYHGSVVKYPPCPACSGRGCADCRGSGLRIVPLLDREGCERVLREAITGANSAGGAFQGWDAAVTGAELPAVTIGGEEMLPDACVLEAVEAVARECCKAARNPTGGSPASATTASEAAGPPECRFGGSPASATLASEAVGPPSGSIRWATWTDLWLKHRDRLLAKAAASDGKPTSELNPAMPGCMVTRRLTKARTRAVAYRLVEAESRLANQSWRAGVPIAPPADFAKAWQQVAFAQFHDAITGTHVDSAYREMMRFLDEAEAVARRYVSEAGLALDSTGRAPAAATKASEAAGPPGCGFGGSPASATRPARPLALQSGWRPHAGHEDTMRLGCLDVRFDRLGILAVAVGKREVLRAQPVVPTMHALRVGELTLESDFGDAWGQRIAPLGDSSMRGLGEFHETVEVADGAIRWHGRYGGGHRKVRTLSWIVEVRASEDGERLDFTCSVDWDTESKRLRAVFPVPIRPSKESGVDEPMRPARPLALQETEVDSSGGSPASATSASEAAGPPRDADHVWLGEIPFGFVERRYDASRTDWSQWHAHQNEYPILHWAQHRCADGGAVALITEGLPCVRWQPGRFDLSLLRSPEWEFCAVEPAHYEFWDTDGQRDAGRHEMRWSLWPAAVAQEPAALTAAGYAFNRPGFVAPPFRVEGSVIATAWKPAEDGQGWILRLQETSGKGTRLRLTFDQPCDMVVTNLLEVPQGPVARTTEFGAHLHRHGLLTVRIQRGDRG